MNRGEKLSHFHTSIFIFMIQSGIAVFSLPQQLANQFGTNGWAAIFLYIAVVCINIALISLVYRMGQGRSIFDILERSISRWVLLPVYLALAVLWLMLGCLIGKQYIMIFQMIAFPTSNPMAFKLLVDLLAFWLITMGIYNISKAATVFFWLIIWMLLLLFAFYTEFSWARLTPFVFKTGEFSTEGYYSIYASFLGYELSLLLFPYIDRKTKLTRSLLWGNAITTVNYVYLCFIAFGFFSLPQLKEMMFPLLIMLAYVKFPFVERVENLFYGFFLFTTLISVIMYNWSAKEALQRILPKVNGNVLAFIAIAVSFVIAFIPDTLGEIRDWLLFICVIQVWVAFGLPIFLIMVLLIQRLRGQNL